MPYKLYLSAILVSIVFLSQSLSAMAATPHEIKDKLPDTSTLEKLTKSTASPNFLDSLQSAASELQDYKCFCRLISFKDEQWKDYGGATLFYKQRERLRAEIVSSDYRNGSVVVKQQDGKIRGKGGGGLSLLKMTIQPDSRSIKLPTGFSLAESDFLSLYASIKKQIASGSSANISAPTSIPAFREQVQILAMRGKDNGLTHVIYFDPHTKLPLAWNTYSDGHSQAFVFFDPPETNKGLSDELFKL